MISLAHTFCHSPLSYKTEAWVKALKPKTLVKNIKMLNMKCFMINFKQAYIAHAIDWHVKFLTK